MGWILGNLGILLRILLVLIQLDGIPPKSYSNILGKMQRVKM